MTELLLKFNSLDSVSRKEVLDFLDFLLVKRTKKVKSEVEEYKNKILSVSQWSEADINEIQKDIQLFGQWKTQEW